MRDCIVCKAPAHAAFCGDCQTEADRRESEFVRTLGGVHRVTTTSPVCIARLSIDPDARRLWLCEMGATALVAAVRVCQPTSARQITDTEARTE